ncbi:hypothetical protein NX862_19080 [Rhodobacter sp. KR11]|uniref:hypothetical protein n=1 Tax=Rhodobacter sp. KR11 TaxID=2974588 RepID=UPI002221A2F3|nr:hypothetical protein [Rhodobacter sp. KR11]MCW1920866.1 hypothetical protein [Rhodobacter sp. KR11]
MKRLQSEASPTFVAGPAEDAKRLPLDALRSALLQLQATGASGFEGLVATVLSKIVGQNFRLSSSGTQNGKDGTLFAATDYLIAFEGKRYDTPLSPADIHAKITQLIASTAMPDLWVLAATVGAGAQMLDTVHAATSQVGIGTLILDWPRTSEIPPLAAACALAHEVTAAFLHANIQDHDCVRKAIEALSAIRGAEAFKLAAEDIVRTLRDPSVALSNARVENVKLMEAIFSEPRLAKAAFGQALTPKAAGPLPIRSRSALVADVQQHLTNSRSGEILAVAGGEGHGKSWLVAQSWLQLADRPLLVFMPAVDLKQAEAYHTFQSFLISKLIQQADHFDGEANRKRWERRLKQWAERPREAGPRFVLCVDGLNQKPEFEWTRWLERAAIEVEKLGGALIVTSRAHYFDERVRIALKSPVVTVSVPEWTDDELREILAIKDTDVRTIKPTVLSQLRNPRILGIAFDLMARQEIHDFDELSVARLLFEHIRAGDRDGNAPEPPIEFTRRLAEHAQTIIDRVTAQNSEDLLIFDRSSNLGGQTLSAALLAVTAERFFRPVPEDPTLYAISDDGLSLALGLAIIRALQKAERNARNVDEALETLLDPIRALDKTADAVFSGLMVSAVDEKCSLTIRRALIGGFLRLQNISEDIYPAFVGVARHATDAAMWALLDLATNARHATNHDWLLLALRDCRQKPECWQIISDHVSTWLRTYSLDPKVGMIRGPGQDTSEKIAEELARKTRDLAQRMADLSADERQFLDKNMRESKDTDLSLLWRNAFELLAGMPLAPFAEPLVACSLSCALNHRPFAPYDEYLALVRFNRRDWQEMQSRLHETSCFLTQGNTSRTGQWALVQVLRAIGTPEDAERAERLVLQLAKNWNGPTSWRLVETYCASDPCDPASTKPENIDATGQNFAQVNVEDVSRHLSMGSDDHFVKEALPGMARFLPDVAIETQRKIARSIVERGASELMRGVYSLERHSAALDQEAVSSLVDVANRLCSPQGLASNNTEEDWITAQGALQAAFPHLDGDDQLDILMGLQSHGAPLLSLARVFKKATPARLESALDLAKQSGEDNRALSVLLFAMSSGTEVTPSGWELVSEFAGHDRSTVRALAMSLIAAAKSTDVSAKIVANGWSAAPLDRTESNSEIWYGSLIVINAAECGLIGVEEALARITPRLYGKAAEVLGAQSYAAIAKFLAAAVGKALEADFPFSPPRVEQHTQKTGTSGLPILSLAEPRDLLGPDAFFKQLSETPEDFETRQRQRWDAFDKFAAALTRQDAWLIIEDVGQAAVDAFVSASPDRCAALGGELLKLGDRKLVRVQNFALRLAQSLSHHDMVLACQLFERFSGRQPVVILVSDVLSLPLEVNCVWESADGELLDNLRMRRLDDAVNDHQIAQEVLAALLAGKAGLIESYVRKRLAGPEPAVIARALTVVGFGLQTAASDAILAGFQGLKGMVGSAARSARFAYDRDFWAQHWFEKMWSANSAVEFWVMSTLFLKIVDARFGIWGNSLTKSGTVISNFAPTIRAGTQSRMRAWKTKREATLYGEKAPGEVYVVVK